MTDWKPGDLCQVRRGKRWVDAEVHDTAFGRPIRLRIDGKLRWLGNDKIRPRQAPRGKLPEPSENARKAREHFAATRETITTTDGRYVLSRPKPVPKPKTARSKDYLAHVRTFPCCSCGATEAIHAHHVASGGMGQKASDYLTAPLCWSCHNRWHATATLPLLPTASSRAVVWEAAARCLVAWVVREGER